jgi:hypothetical protein
MQIKSKIEKIKRETRRVNLVVVTKGRSVEEIIQAIENGAVIIGESIVQEAEDKYHRLEEYFKKNNIKFHFIGHLQLNKAKRAVSIFDMIQSVDSFELATEIDKRAREMNKIQDILVQVNIGREAQKHGIMPEDTVESVSKISKLKNVKIRGLMCIAPYFEDPEKTRPYFRQAKQIFNKLNLEFLSMGMTHDYKIAIEEGANMIRIGRGIFEGKN